MPDVVPDRMLRWVFSGLALVALAGTLQASLKNTPHPHPVELTGLNVPGHQLQALASQSELANDSHAYGELKQWSVRGIADTGNSFQLGLVMVHSRTEKDAEFELLAAHPAFASLENRRAITTGSQPKRPDTVSIADASDQKVLQTCLVRPGGAHANKDDFLAAIRSAREDSWSRRLRQIAGLEDNFRWECLLVTMSMPKEQASDEALLNAWNSVYPALRARLQQQ